MKKTIFLLLVVTFSILGYTQNVSYIAPLKKSPLSLNVSTGISMGKGIGNTSFFNSYVMPMLNFSPVGKWKIISGLKAETSTFSLPSLSFNSENPSNTQSYRLNRYSLLVGANYQWTNKLSISGIFKYSQNLWDNHNSDVLKQYLPSYSYSAIVGFDYKVTENIRIEGSFQYQKNEPFQTYMNGGVHEQFYPYNVFNNNIY